LLDRVEAEQAYWARKRGLSAEDATAEREFSRIMHTYLSLQAALDAARDTLEGRRSDYWETRPGDSPAAAHGGLVLDDEAQKALVYGLRAAERDAGQ